MDHVNLIQCNACLIQYKTKQNKDSWIPSQEDLMQESGMGPCDLYL